MNTEELLEKLKRLEFTAEDVRNIKDAIEVLKQAKKEAKRLRYSMTHRLHIWLNRRK